MSVPIPPSVGLVLIRSGLLPELALRPGTVLPARVLAAEAGRGLIALAGVRLAAALPEGLAEGDALRLRVEEASGERLVLKVLEQPAQGATGTQQATAATPPGAFALALPGGATARAWADPEAEGEGEAAREARGRVVTLRYDSPRLGRLDVVLAIDGEQVTATVLVAAGDPARAAREASGALREALRGAVGRPAQVSVHARDETVDVRV